MIHYQNKSDINEYREHKLKILKQFGIKIDECIRDELHNLNNEFDIDHRCRTIICNHLDEINEKETALKRVGKKLP